MMLRPTRIPRLALAGLALALGAAACARDSYQIGILQVTAIAAPDTIAPTDTLRVALSFTTGGCLSYERTDLARTTAGALMAVMGRQALGGVCTADIRYEQKTVVLAPPFTDPFRVEVLQPDGTSTIKQVRIIAR